MIRTPGPFRGTNKIDYRKSACHGPPLIDGGLGQACVTDAIGLAAPWMGGSPLQHDGLFVGSARDGSAGPHGLEGLFSVRPARILHHLALGIPYALGSEVVMAAPTIALGLAYVYARQLLDALAG